MGVDTKAIIRKDVTVEQIEKAIVDKYPSVVSVQSSTKGFYWINFHDGDEQRSIFISYSDSCLNDYGIDGVWLSIGCYGKSVEIMKHLCETFGGYLDENDCDDEGFYPINFELYEKGVLMTELNSLRHEIITRLGYQNLNATIALFEKYYKIRLNSPL